MPSSFIGGRRDMTQRYEDDMTIVLNGGKPDIFLTMTCNPSWSEITSELLPFLNTTRSSRFANKNILFEIRAIEG